MDPTIHLRIEQTIIVRMWKWSEFEIGGWKSLARIIRRGLFEFFNGEIKQWNDEQMYANDRSRAVSVPKYQTQL